MRILNYINEHPIETGLTLFILVIAFMCIVGKIRDTGRKRFKNFHDQDFDDYFNLGV